MALEPEDAAMFKEEFSHELVIPRLIQISYDLLNVHSFFTAGDMKYTPDSAQGNAREVAERSILTWKRLYSRGGDLRRPAHQAALLACTRRCVEGKTTSSKTATFLK